MFPHVAGAGELLLLQGKLTLGFWTELRLYRHIRTLILLRVWFPGSRLREASLVNCVERHSKNQTQHSNKRDVSCRCSDLWPLGALWMADSPYVWIWDEIKGSAMDRTKSAGHHSNLSKIKEGGNKGDTSRGCERGYGKLDQEGGQAILWVLFVIALVTTHAAAAVVALHGSPLNPGWYKP